jgi:hypothetical protein
MRNFMAQPTAIVEYRKPEKCQAFDLIDRSLEYLYKGGAGFSSSEKAG